MIPLLTYATPFAIAVAAFLGFVAYTVRTGEMRAEQEQAEVTPQGFAALYYPSAADVARAESELPEMREP